MRGVSKEFLQLLDLLLGSSELLGDDADMLACGEVLGRLCLSGRWRFAADIVKVVLAVYPEVGVLEFENLQDWLDCKQVKRPSPTYIAIGRSAIRIGGWFDFVKIVFV